MPIIIRLLLVLIFIIAFIEVTYLTGRHKRIILPICIFFVLIGLGIYIAAYLSTENGFSGNPFIAVVRGIFSTMAMLSFRNEYGTVAGIQGTAWLTKNIYMQFLFWLCHISALVLLQTALIYLFGRAIIDSLRLRAGLHREVYVIKSCDEYALALGANIAFHDNQRQGPDNKRLIVFLINKEDDEKKTHQKTDYFGGVVKKLDSKNNLPFYLKEAGLGKRRRRKYKIVLTQDDISTPQDVRLIVNYAKEKKVSPEDDNLDIYVLASSEWNKEEIESIAHEKEDGKRKYPYTLHITNEKNLLIRQMIEKYPPFECPALNFKNGIASHDFTVLILGFGSIGQTALLYLVRNGQFIGSNMRAVIVDKNMEKLRDSFLHRYSALPLCCNMEFKNFDIQSEKFYTLLDEINNADYVVIALNNVETNKQTALDLSLHYRRNNNPLPFIAVMDEKSPPNKAKHDKKIFTFGCREEIYNEEFFISEKLDRMAKAVNNVYKEMYGGAGWHELDWFAQESSRASADFIPAMLKLANTNENEAIANNTLTTDNALAETLAKTEHLRWNSFHAAMGYRVISIEEMRQRFKNYTGEKNTRAHLDYCRRDVPLKKHSCLVTWDELDKVSEVYCELAKLAGNSKEQKRDFKENDRDNIRNIPTFIKEAKKRDI